MIVIYLYLPAIAVAAAVAAAAVGQTVLPVLIALIVVVEWLVPLGLLWKPWPGFVENLEHVGLLLGKTMGELYKILKDF